jgi:hypothetical protein
LEGGVNMINILNKLWKIFNEFLVLFTPLLIAVFLINWLYLKTDIIPTNLLDFIATYSGTALTILGFYFVVRQITTLAEQVQNEKERHNKDSEFKNFLEATKMLTSSENKDNFDAQISAMYLLYDSAKIYPKNNLEKAMKVLNRYIDPIYGENQDAKADRKPITNRETIDGWRETRNLKQQVALTALELNKKLFVHALEKGLKNISLSNIVIFDFDIEKDISNDQDDSSKKVINISKIFSSNSKMVFLNCNFTASGKKEVSFSTDNKNLSNDSVKNRMDMTLSRFIECELKWCDFSNSNLWGISFENCELNRTKFEKAECEGVEFTGTTIVEEEQLKQMLFIEKKIANYRNKSPHPDSDIGNNPIKYGVIYSPLPTDDKELKQLKRKCFKDREEYNDFKNRWFKEQNAQ